MCLPRHPAVAYLVLVRCCAISQIDSLIVTDCGAPRVGATISPPAKRLLKFRRRVSPLGGSSSAFSRCSLAVSSCSPSSVALLLARFQALATVFGGLSFFLLSFGAALGYF